MDALCFWLAGVVMGCAVSVTETSLLVAKVRDLQAHGPDTTWVTRIPFTPVPQQPPSLLPCPQHTVCSTFSEPNEGDELVVTTEHDSRRIRYDGKRWRRVWDL